MARILSILALLSVVVFAVSPAEGGQSKKAACGAQEFAYAGLQADDTAHGVRATIAPLATPNVADGHVAGWIGVGGVDAGPHGKAEWLQTGLASFAPSNEMFIYYEVTVAGRSPAYHEVKADVQPGEKHDLAILEVRGHDSWWRVWVDGKPVTRAIHLPGSHDKWYPQALAENWNGGTGTCNTYAYRFSNVRLAETNGGSWKSLDQRSLFEDPGYQVVQTSRTPSNFVATSV
jgi:hypothetical protein